MDTADESVLTDISVNDQHQDLECHDTEGGAEVNAFFVSTRITWTEVITVPPLSLCQFFEYPAALGLGYI